MKQLMRSQHPGAPAPRRQLAGTAISKKWTIAEDKFLVTASGAEIAPQFGHNERAVKNRHGLAKRDQDKRNQVRNLRREPRPAALA